MTLLSFPTPLFLSKYFSLLKHGGLCLIGSLFILVALLPLSAWGDEVNTLTELEKGKYLTQAANCYACHTNDPTLPYAGGKALVTPMGTIYSTNITPDETTGIGNWSDAEFYRTLNDGIGKHGEHLYPVMPFDAYTGISYEDAMAIKAYLLAQPPIKHADKPHELQFPYNYRAIIGGWKLLNFHEGTLKSDPNKSEQLNRGAYIGEALAHCGVCHTPRTATMATDPTRALTGAPITGGWYAPNITPDKLNGIGKWSDIELKEFLRTGTVFGKAHASGPMGEVVQHALSHLTEEDMDSLILWLRDTPFDGRAGSNSLSRADWGRPKDLTQEALENFYASAPEGSIPDQADALIDLPPLSEVTSPAIIYYMACANCHGLDASGNEALGYPKLPHNTTLGMSRANNLVMTLLDGIHRTSEGRSIQMPAFRGQLSDEQITSLANWLFANYGRPTTSTTPEAVNNLRFNRPEGKTPLMAVVQASGVAIFSIVLIFILGWVIRLSPRFKAYLVLLRRKRHHRS